jgi:radical SAM protein with 4Fe4S-binding SPASM domain
MNHEQDTTALFEGWRARIETLMREHPLQIISWEATRRCNLRCLHCGSPTEEVNNTDELTADEIINAFDEIARDFDMSRFRHINITGGEPFVRSDLLDVLRAISRWPSYRNIDIQTNGVFISDNPSVRKELKGVGVTGLGVSIDGFEPAHDLLRGKPGTWTKAVNAARLAVDAGYVVTVSFVAHSKNINELAAFHRFITDEIHPRVFRVMLIDPQGRTQENDDYLPSSAQVREMIDFLKMEYTRSCSTYSDPSSTMVELGCGGWLGTELEGRVRPFIFHCIAGLNNLGILYDGKLGSCSNVSREFTTGNVRDGMIRQTWDTKYQQYRDRTWLYTGPCASCLDWCYCHGGPMHLRGSASRETTCLLRLLHDNDYGTIHGAER